MSAPEAFQFIQFIQVPRADGGHTTIRIGAIRDVTVDMRSYSKPGEPERLVSFVAFDGGSVAVTREVALAVEEQRKKYTGMLTILETP